MMNITINHSYRCSSCTATLPTHRRSATVGAFSLRAGLHRRWSAVAGPRHLSGRCQPLHLAGLDACHRDGLSRDHHALLACDRRRRVHRRGLEPLSGERAPGDQRSCVMRPRAADAAAGPGRTLRLLAPFQIRPAERPDEQRGTLAGLSRESAEWRRPTPRPPTRGAPPPVGHPAAGSADAGPARHHGLGPRAREINAGMRSAIKEIHWLDNSVHTLLLGVEQEALSDHAAFHPARLGERRLHGATHPLVRLHHPQHLLPGPDHPFANERAGFPAVDPAIRGRSAKSHVLRSHPPLDADGGAADAGAVGLLSDHSTLRWAGGGPSSLAARWRPWSASSPSASASLTGLAGYTFFFAVAILLSVAANAGQAAQQAVIPASSRKISGRFSGVKAILEVPLPLILVSFTIARSIAGGNMWAACWRPWPFWRSVWRWRC